MKKKNILVDEITGIFEQITFDNKLTKNGG